MDDSCIRNSHLHDSFVQGNDSIRIIGCFLRSMGNVLLFFNQGSNSICRRQFELWDERSPTKHGSRWGRCYTLFVDKCLDGTMGHFFDQHDRSEARLQQCFQFILFDSYFSTRIYLPMGLILVLDNTSVAVLHSYDGSWCYCCLVLCPSRRFWILFFGSERLCSEKFNDEFWEHLPGSIAYCCDRVLGHDCEDVEKSSERTEFAQSRF
mmetsp:Transcript_25254/g.37413  ORF Transcript_25254/g.37413 Transcript_25254/m.37413 type:complete len:208 (+) Transcript_25254:163-786(+)